MCNKISQFDYILNRFTSLLAEGKKKYSNEKINDFDQEIDKILAKNEKNTIENIVNNEFLKSTKNSQLFEEIKNFCLEYGSKESLEKNFYELIEDLSNKFLREENLENLRKYNKEIRLLKFENNTEISYIGETSKGKEDILPTKMHGFGLYKNQNPENEFFLGNFHNENFNRGIWVKNKQNYFIGEFKFDEINNDRKTFSGTMIHVDDDKENEKSVNFKIGNLDFLNSTFNGISIKYYHKSKEILFDAGVFKDGKKNSIDFLTIKLFLEENQDKENVVSSFKIIFTDYESDEIKKFVFIQDEFSVLKMFPKENKFYSIVSYDNNTIYKGDFIVKDVNEIIPIFNGNGILIDCDSDVKYSGEFVDGKRNGKGILLMNFVLNKNNSIDNRRKSLEGEFCNDNFTYGDVIEEGKKIIENGEFDENFFLKRGKIYFEKGEFYDGDFRNNKRDGRGVYRYENKYEYHGQWKNGLRDGEGTLFMEDREKPICGEWHNNDLIKITLIKN